MSNVLRPPILELARWQHSPGRRRSLISAECGNMRFSKRGNVIDEHLALRLDIYLVWRVAVEGVIRVYLGVVNGKLSPVWWAVEVGSTRVVRVNRSGSRAIHWV